MVKDKIANELKRIGFAPSRGGYRYPFDILGIYFERESATARVMGYKNGEESSVVGLKESMLEGDLDIHRIDEHPTFRMLQRSLPPRAHTKSSKGLFHYTHYERIGWYVSSGGRLYTRNRLAGMAHVRHVAIIKSDTEYSYGGPWYGNVVYQLQLLNMWSGVGLVGNFEKAIVKRALDHIGQIGAAAVNVMDNIHGGDYHYNTEQIHVFAEVQHSLLDEDLAETAERTTEVLSGHMDDASDEWYALEDSGVTLSGVRINSISKYDEEEIEKVTTEGIGVLKKAKKPKADPGVKHLLVDVTDKSLVVLSRGTSKELLIGNASSEKSGNALKWRVVVDEGSRVFYVEPLTRDEDTKDVTGFLERAWDRKPELLFEGPPKTIEVPKSYLKKWPNLGRWLSDRGVVMVHPNSGLGLGVAIGRNWLVESKYSTLGKHVLDLSGLKQWSYDHQLVISAKGWFSNPDDPNPIGISLFITGEYEEHHYTGIRVDTRRFISAVGREGVEEIFEQQWPSLFER